jgi:hypothetical protein
MAHIWFVTFEVHRRGLVSKHQTTRRTKTFETETLAKDFARAKLNEGLVVFAGPINPYLPKQLIPSHRVSLWLEGAQKQQATRN